MKDERASAAEGGALAGGMSEYQRLFEAALERWGEWCRFVFTARLRDRPGRCEREHSMPRAARARLQSGPTPLSVGEMKLFFDNVVFVGRHWLWVGPFENGRPYFRTAQREQDALSVAWWLEWHVWPQVLPVATCGHPECVYCEHLRQFVPSPFADEANRGSK